MKDLVFQGRDMVLYFSYRLFLLFLFLFLFSSTGYQYTSEGLGKIEGELGGYIGYIVKEGTGSSTQLALFCQGYAIRHKCLHQNRFLMLTV